MKAADAGAPSSCILHPYDQAKCTPGVRAPTRAHFRLSPEHSLLPSVLSPQSSVLHTRYSTQQSPLLRLNLCTPRNHSPNHDPVGTEDHGARFDRLDLAVEGDAFGQGAGDAFFDLGGDVGDL